MEIEWKWIIVLDPEDSARPKPSASAIPMPEGMNKKLVSIENRQDGVPKMDEPFHDNEANKWAEFITLDMPPTGYRSATIKNKEQTKVNMSHADQLYFYLFKHSTETRDKYSNDAASNSPCTKAEFLERVKPAPAMINRGVASQASNGHRPYAYKPKAGQLNGGATMNQVPGLDAQDARRSSFNGLPIGVTRQLPPLRPQSSDPCRGMPDRQFPEHEYYSSKVLPAAYPGQYSNYTQHVRQNSGGSEKYRRPSFGFQSPYASSSSAPVAPMVGMSPSPYAHAHPAPQPLQPAPQFTSGGKHRHSSFAGRSL